MRLERAILLAIHVAARQKHPSEPIPGEEMAALAKLLAEAGAEEIKTILGWVFDFRRLLLSLPENKFVAWTSDIRSIIEQRTVKPKELESSIGRLVHLSLVIPHVHHFLSRLRGLLKWAQNCSKINVNATSLEDILVSCSSFWRRQELVPA